MIMYRQLPMSVRTIFGIYILLLLIPSLYIWIGNIITGRCGKGRIGTFLPVFLGILTFQGISDVEIGLEGEPGMSVLGRIAGSMSRDGMILWMVFVTVVVIWEAIYQNRQKKNSITSESIRESLDILPDGVCFYTDDGFPVLINITMNRLCGEIFGSGIMNGSKVWRDIREKRGKDGIEFIDQGSQKAVKLKDGHVWKFQRKKVMAEDREFWELTACDITKEYNLNKELEVRGKQLAQVNERLRQFSRNVKKVTRNEEILAAKMKVHDEVGRSLLQMRFWLEQGAHREDADELLFTWRFISEQMKYGGIMDDSESTDSITEAAKELRVTLVRQGDLPSDRKKAGIIAEALKECMNNVVKHAGGRMIYFSAWEKMGEYHACFTNDGAAPVSKIQERGGLKNLRMAVEKQGGCMKITSFPSFKLEIVFPGEEKE